MINTKTKIKDFSFNSNYPYFPNYDTPSCEKMTQRQRQTLTELIYSKISDAIAVEERLQELESFNYNDARQSIKELSGSNWR